MSGISRKRFKEAEFLNFEIPGIKIEIQRKTWNKIKQISKTMSEQELESTNQISYVRQLRQAILQEALEGKLTAQWRQEHPDLISGENHASKLIEKIKTEKAKLIKDGKVKKEKPLATITDKEKPFILPEGWIWCRLAELGTTQTGTTPSTTDKTNFGNYIPFIKPGDISLKRIDYLNEGLSQKGLSEVKVIRKNSLLMVCIGGSIGKSFFTDRDTSCNQQINVITPVKEIDVSFLQLFLQSKYFQTEVRNNAMKSSTPIINKGKWEQIPIPIPPQSEQNSIIERVNILMTMIDALEKQVFERKERSEMLMHAVLREAFEAN